MPLEVGRVLQPIVGGLIFIGLIVWVSMPLEVGRVLQRSPAELHDTSC